jgi:hypothetical protein
VSSVMNSFSTVLLSPAGTVRFSTPTIVPVAPRQIVGCPAVSGRR